jgi:P4 family phage/plasmid primase-like protien
MPSPKGLLKLACEAFPPQLIIPVAPPSAARQLGENLAAAATAKGFDDKTVAAERKRGEASAGKAPARWTGTEWRHLAKWEIGCSQADRDLSDERKANVGLLLGLPAQGATFVILDLDMETDDSDPESIKTRVATEVVERILYSLQTHLKEPLWVRLTKPGRAAILFEIAEGQAAGDKQIFHLSHEQHGNLGKIEVLSTGQQCCIAGVHPVTRKPIQWYRTDVPDVKLPLPDTSSGVYTFETRGHFDTALGIALSYLARSHVQSTTTKVRSSAKVETVNPEDQAPPSAIKLLLLLARLPHTADVDRDLYVATMLAISGCLQALEKLKRVTAEERAAIRTAAISWACRWEDPNGDGTSIAQETAKWDNDWSTTRNIVAGWHSLINTAVSLGLEDLRTEELQESFAAFELDEPEPAPFVYEPIVSTAPKSKYEEPVGTDEVIPTPENGYTTADMLNDPNRPRRREATDFNVPEADIMMADMLENVLKGRIKYREDLKKWIVWQGTRHHWSTVRGERVLRRWIENCLVTYAQKHFYGMDGSKISKFTSGARVDTMEKMLRFRLGEEGPGKLNTYFLQCPDGAYDLRTGEKLTDLQQRALEETRSTIAKPVPGDTPIFDNIVSLVCANDEETVNWLWHYLGYLMLGDPLNHNMLVIHGTGGNGKGALCRTLQKCLGSYAIEASRDLVIDSAKNKHKTALYDLKGKRMWFVSEISPGEEWNEAQVKSLTGGDQISANRMHHDMDYFHPEGSFIIATNNLPKFHKIDDAILRRFLVISARIKPEKDLTIEKRLQEAGELRHILHKLIHYAKVVYQNNFVLPKIPEAMDKETKRYFKDQDIFYTWFNEECDSSGLHQGDVSIRDLKARYEAYVKRNSGMNADDTVFGQVDSLSEPQFVAELKRKGCLVDRVNGEPSVLGIRFKVGPVRSVA